jgi:hypothetical protein
VPPEYNLLNGFKRLQQQYSNLTAKWTGLSGNDHASGVGECERLLQDSNCFIFNGMERFLSYFNSSKIGSFDLNGNFVFFI